MTDKYGPDERPADTSPERGLPVAGRRPEAGQPRPVGEGPTVPLKLPPPGDEPSSIAAEVGDEPTAVLRPAAAPPAEDDPTSVLPPVAARPADRAATVADEPAPVLPPAADAPLFGDGPASVLPRSAARPADDATVADEPTSVLRPGDAGPADRAGTGADGSTSVLPSGVFRPAEDDSPVEDEPTGMLGDGRDRAADAPPPVEDEPTAVLGSGGERAPDALPVGDEPTSVLGGDRAAEAAPPVYGDPASGSRVGGDLPAHVVSPAEDEPSGMTPGGWPQPATGAELGRDVAGANDLAAGRDAAEPARPGTQDDPVGTLYGGTAPDISGTAVAGEEEPTWFVPAPGPVADDDRAWFEVPATETAPQAGFASGAESDPGTRSARETGTGWEAEAGTPREAGTAPDLGSAPGTDPAWEAATTWDASTSQPTGTGTEWESGTRPAREAGTVPGAEPAVPPFGRGDDDVTTRLSVPLPLAERDEPGQTPGAAGPFMGGVPSSGPAVDDEPTVERVHPVRGDDGGATRRLRPPPVAPVPAAPASGTTHTDPQPEVTDAPESRPASGPHDPAATEGRAGVEGWAAGSAGAGGAAAGAGRDGGESGLGDESAGSAGRVTPGRGGESRVPLDSSPLKKLVSAGTLIWVLLALFGFTLVVQLRSNNSDEGLASARQDDLVRILSDLEARDTRLQAEIAALENSQRQLTSGVAGRQAALAEAEKRAGELGLLAGTLPGRGPGLEIRIDGVKASAILNAVQELRGAGGEVMQLSGSGGRPVRIVASTFFVDAEGGGISADGVRLRGPYVLTVIGTPQTMQTALEIPGGVVASVTSGGGSVTMQQRTSVDVTAVREAASLQYARPVS